MDVFALEQRRRAWELAHKILSIVGVLPRLEGKRLLVVSTGEIGRAMGVPEKAKLEEVQRFVFDVISFMKGSPVHIACGCGYLSLMVCRQENHEEIIEDRAATAFSPESLDAFFETHVLASTASDSDTVQEICDRQ